MTRYEEIKEQLQAAPKTWLVTGVAGFIGSNLLETLLLLNQKVVGLDNFATGHQRNLDEVKGLVSTEQWNNFNFVEGDIRNYEDCEQALKHNNVNVDYVLHQAALGSVPRSIANPVLTNSANITGFLNMLTAAKEAQVLSFTYAASSSTYGDHPALPKVEENIGNPLSPYAVTKYVNELYADVFARTYDFKAIGLRYFNVFGKRQDPNGAYAAVIPKWTASMINNEEVFINGDGETSRDFCFIENVVQMNILAATSNTPFTLSERDEQSKEGAFSANPEFIGKNNPVRSELVERDNTVCPELVERDNTARFESVESNNTVCPEPVERDNTVHSESVEGNNTVCSESVERDNTVRSESVEGNNTVCPELVEGNNTVCPELVEGSAVYNVAVGDRTTLNDLFTAIKSALKSNDMNVELEPVYQDFRAGDVRHSQADISKAKSALGYEPEFRISEGIAKAMPWYIQFLK